MTTGPQPRRDDDAGARAEDDLGFDLPEPAHLSRTRAAIAALIAASVLGAAFAAAYLPKRRARAELEQQARSAEDGRLRVEVVFPKLGSSNRALALPGSVQPLMETTVFSRANGFVHRWLVDIGDVVVEGQLLAELDTPELDQQIAQARAQLVQAQAAIGQARASRDYSKSTYQRYRPLTEQGVTSQQDLDQRQAQAAVDEANVKVADANVAAQEANIRRLLQLKGFARVTAPFAGKITARTVEIGTLVAEGTASPLFRLAALDPARVFVQVPQDVAPSVRAEVPAKVSVREYPSRVFEGKVTRASGELDPASRTMNTEVRVPNGDGALIPGMYARVALDLPIPHRVLEIPATAVTNDARGMHVAVVGPDGVVHQTPIVVERDTGATFEVSGGLSEIDRVARIASSELTDGRPVIAVTQ
ncbi:MAG TPA: efflux RND transporter periplasmic adaptor subunit [Polyangiaceae bacterium]|nr:efflux RND transporter periplasmic adaptor subunit [Polyangiaceae bacterium]